MANILATLGNSAGALDAYQKVLAVTQNNVANASTPGYARQSLALEAMPMDQALGMSGGVRTGRVESARDEYAEQAVRRQTVALGQAQQNVNSLTALQNQFDITGASGISSTLNVLFQSFSAWGQSPSSQVARQSVIDHATAVADAFSQAASGLEKLTADTESQLQQSVGQVNQLVTKLQGYNQQIFNGSRNDPGIDTQIHSTLDQLSQYVDFTATWQDNGSVSVLLSSETPVLLGDKSYPLSYSLQSPASDATYPDAPPSAHIFGADGRDITSKTTNGQLGALLNVHNTVLPSYLGDGTHAGDLNTMAEQFADRVNQILTSGFTTDVSDGTDGSMPQAGVPLFQYATTTEPDGSVVAQHTRVAKTLRVDPNVTTGQLGAISGTPTASSTQPVTLTNEISNGIPLALTNLSSPTDPADMVNGTTSFSSWYGGLAARVGAALSNATDQLQVQHSTIAQAKDLRDQISGVSLDEEAMVMIQFQRAYEANSKLITILDQLTQDAINILRT